jgi:hypothetical protein
MPLLCGGAPGNNWSLCGPRGSADAAPAKFRPAGGRGQPGTGAGWCWGALCPIWEVGPSGEVADDDERWHPAAAATGATAPVSGAAPVACAHAEELT